MSYTNPSAYENTYLQAYYDFSHSGFYNNIANKSCYVYDSRPPEVDSSGNYIPRDEIYYNSDKAVVNNFQDYNSTIELIQEYGVDVELASYNSGFFIGDYSNVTGHFNQGYSSLGANFSGCAISINNSRNFTHGESTFIFSYTKKSKKPEILFSSINKYTNLGFEIGVNSANKLYLEWTEDYGSQVATLNTVNYNKNIYVVDIDTLNNKLVLSRWDGFEERLLSKSIYFEACECFKGNNLSWIVGSGTYRGDEGINYQDEPYKCESYIDKFLYFNGPLADHSKVDFIKSLYEQVDYLPRLYENYERGIIGYEKSIDYSVSGIVKYEDVITGYKNYIADYSQIISHEMKGSISAGDKYYELDTEYVDNLNVGGNPNISGIYITKTAPGNLSNVITGFNNTFENKQYSWSDIGISSEPLYYHSGIEGKLYDVYKYDPIYSEPGTFLKDNGEYMMSGVFPLIAPDGENGFGPTRYTYLGARNKRTDYLEHFQGINPFSINNFADIESFNKFDPAISVSFSSDLEYDYNKIALYVNGVSQSWGELKFIDDDCNTSQDRWELVSGNFGIYNWPIGNVDVGINKIMYNDNNISLLVDHPVVDVLEDVPSTGVWANYEMYSQWTGGFGKQIEKADKIFFNGQKLISGESYYFDEFDNFQMVDPDNFFGQSSGYFYSERSFYRDEDNTFHEIERGREMFDLKKEKPFIPYSNVSYLNGIRLDPKAHIYHSDVDLLEQGKAFIIETESFTTYNNSVTYSDQQPTEMNLYESPEYGENWALEYVLDDAGNIVDTSTENTKVIKNKQVRSRRSRKGSVTEKKLYENSKKIADIAFYPLPDPSNNIDASTSSYESNNDAETGSESLGGEIITFRKRHRK